MLRLALAVVSVIITGRIVVVLLQKEIVSSIFSPKLKSISVQNFTYRDVQPYYLPKVSCHLSVIVVSYCFINNGKNIAELVFNLQSVREV